MTRLVTHIAVAKFDDHRPLYRQAEIYARDGVDLATSTLLGWVGATAAALSPLVDLLRQDVIYGDDTPVPVLAPGLGRTALGLCERRAASTAACVRRPPCSWQAARSAAPMAPGPIPTAG